MKKALFSFLFLALTLPSWGQYYYASYEGVGRNPGNLNQEPETPFVANEPRGWTLVLPGSATQSWSAVQPLPFSFQLGGQTFNEFKVSSTGVLTFDLSASAVPSSTNTTIPSTEIPNLSICVWGLHSQSTNEAITSKTFGTFPNRQHWISFRGYEYPEASFPIANVHWSIVLEEFTNRVYIVDQRSPTIGSWAASLTLGIQLDGSSAFQVEGSPDIANLSTNSGLFSDNSYYAFQVGEQPANDAEVLSADPKDILILDDAPYEVSTRIFSLGSEPLRTLRLRYSIDGQEVGTHQAQDVASGSVITHRIPWIPEVAGTYELRVWADLPNGAADPSPTNNEVTNTVRVINNPPDRLSLIESFTAHNCGPCATGNPILDAVVDNNYPAVAHLKFVTVFLGQTDPRRLFNPTDNAARVSYYGINSIPTAVINGTSDKNSASVNNNDISSGDNLPGQVDVLIDHSINGSNIAMSVDFTAINNDYVGQNIVGHVALVQNELNYPNATGSNGEKDYYYSMRYMLPNASGTTLPMDGTTTTVSGTRPISPIFNGSLMHMVAYVQNNSTKEILMATKSPGMYFCNNGSVINVDEMLVERPSCAGATNGRIELQLSGGAEPYNVSWTGTSSAGLVADNLTAGNYTATITDQAGCTFELPTRVQPGSGINMEIEAEFVSCNGASDASLKAVAKDGTYNYTWSTGATTPDIADLAPGTYSLTITDASGCSAADEVTLVEPAVLAATAIQAQPVSSNDGEATVEVAGGTPPYTYAWNTTPVQNTATATGLSTGTYEVIVSDANGCSTTSTVNLTTTSIDKSLSNLGLSQWQVSPNPAHESVDVQIEFAAPQAATLRLYDQQGRVVRTQVLSTTQRYQQRWDLSRLSPGFYSLQVQTEQGQAQRRLIVR
jgi:thiol-disulfide isomerase/thioredoxin